MDTFCEKISSATTFEELEQVTASTSDLSDLFGVSDRQIELLAHAGVLENIGTSRAMRFRLVDACQQYCTYLLSGVSLRDWCKDV